MTETVAVPVELLKNIQKRYPIATGNFDYLKELVGLIPTPPKAGDVLTAEQIADLPVGSVVIDDGDDPWIVRPNGKVLYFVDSDTVDNRQYPKTLFGPYTLAYLAQV